MTEADNRTPAEIILDKYYPSDRTLFRENILKAMEEYAQQYKDNLKLYEELITNRLYLEGHNSGYIQLAPIQ